MLAVRTPGAPQTTRVVAVCDSAFPFERQGRLLRSRSISGLCSRSLDSDLQPPCLRFAAAVTGRHARLGSRLLARLCRGRHRRRQTSTRLQGATLIEPDMQISRIRLSDKTSRLRPRHVAPKPGQTYELELLVEVREWIAPAPAPPDFVLGAQPPAQPHSGVVVERPIRVADRAYVEVVRPSAQHAVQLVHQLCGLLPCPRSIGQRVDFLNRALDAFLRWPLRQARLGSFGSRVRFICAWVKLPRSFRYPRSKPVCMTRLIFERDQPHIRSPFRTAAPTSRLRRAGLGRAKPFCGSAFKPWLTSVRPPGSARTDQVLEDLRIYCAFEVGRLSSRLPR